MSRRSLFIVSAFVLVFVSLGSLYISNSEASGHDCVTRTYRYAPNNYYWCVWALQGSLQMINHFEPQIAYVGNADGYYGWNTYNAVRSFQAHAPLTVDGVAGPKTWQQICFWLQDEETRSVGTWRYSVVHTDMYDDGCNLDGIY
jgi:hypothetical protein